MLLALVVCVSVFGLTKTELDSICRQFELQEIEVRSQKSEITTTLPAQRLNGEKLEALSSHSVADALRYFSGVQIKDFGGVGGMKTIDIRSMGTHHLGVFYDGIEIGNAQNGTVDLGKFSLDNIEEIALYNGQKTDIFQPAKDFGSAGTLYISTRRPRFENGRNYHIIAAVKAGSFGLANPSLLYEHKLTENIHLSLNAEYTYATGRYHFRIHRVYPDGLIAWDTTGVRQNGDVQTERAEAGLFGYLPNGKWHIKGYFYNSEKGIPRAIIRNVWTSSQRQWDRNAFVQGNFTNTWYFKKKSSDQVQRSYSLQANIKYSNDYMRYLNPDTTMVYINNQFWQQEVYASIANQWTLFPWWDIDISADYIWNKLDATLANFVNPQRHTGLVAVASAWHYKWIKAQLSCLGTFIEDRCSIVKTTDIPGTASVIKQKPRFTPMASLSYQPILKEQLYLRGYYKQVFRMPTFNDLYYTDMGNIHLEPEEAIQYDGGIEYSKQFTHPHATCSTIDLHIKADGYFNQIKNKIVAVPKGNSQYRWMMMNLGYVEIRGIDVNAGLDFEFPIISSPSKPITLSISGIYTYQKAQDFTDSNDPLTYGGQISYIPWHSCSAIANMAWNGFAINYAFIYVGERYHNSANILANYEQPWYTHDLSLSKIWDLPLGKLSTAVEINNLLNQQYNVILNYPMPGINGKLVIKYIL